MRMPCTYKSSTLRFKRWSRKGYAAFISIQRSVTIGQLKSSLTERFQKKNISLHNVISSIWNNNHEIDEKEDDSLGYFGEGLLSNTLSLAMLTTIIATESDYNQVYGLVSVYII